MLFSFDSAWQKVGGAVPPPPGFDATATLRPLIVGGLIEKRGLAIFPEEINREGVNKWKWVDFVMQC